MALRVWLPLNGNLQNLGCSNYTISVFRGTETYDNAGKIGKCFYAHGTNALKIQNILPDIYNYSAYSLCAWCYIESQNTMHPGSGIISGGNWNRQLLNLAMSNWSSDHYTKLRISGTYWNRTYNYDFYKNTWYHIVVCDDGAHTYAYVNGNLIGDTAASFLPTSIEGSDICIGGATYSSGMQFFGKINDVRIYDHCLSVAEVHEISQGLVLHYKLDDLENGVLDSSGYGHNGTILNAPLTLTSSPRYDNGVSFTATNKKIKSGEITTSGFSNSYSISWWGKSNTYSGTMHWGFGNGVRLNGIYGGNLWNTGDGTSNPLYNPGTTTQVTAPTANEWHHFVMTGDGTTCKAYKDGILWGQAKTYKTISGTIIYINGWDTSTSYSYSNLQVSDFRIYSTPLSADDILALYHTSAKVDNLQNIHSYEFNETTARELLAVPLTTSYSTHTNILTAYDDNGEITLTGNSSRGSVYIPISPAGKTYYYDIDVSIDAGNQFYLGFERFDVDKTATSNSSCDYVISTKPSTALVHQHYYGTRTWSGNLSTGKPPAYIALRILNDWSGANGRKATVHSISLREVTTLSNEQILKTGVFNADEFIEGEKAAIQKNKIVRGKNLIEL